MDSMSLTEEIMTRQMTRILLTLSSMLVQVALVEGLISDPAYACGDRQGAHFSVFGLWDFSPRPLITFPSTCPEDLSTALSETTGGGPKGATLAPEARVRQFVHSTYDNLVEDLARGRGEYVNSLSTLLHVRRTEEDAFAARLQDWLFSERMQEVTPDALANAAREIAH